MSAERTVFEVTGVPHYKFILYESERDGNPFLEFLAYMVLARLILVVVFLSH